MHRIDGTGATTSLPTPSAVGSTVGYFTSGNPGAGAPATVVTVDWANAVQEEIVTCILQNNGSMDKTVQTGLQSALLHLTTNRPGLIQNVGLATSVGSSALTISLKDVSAGSLSSTNIARISFGSSTAANGTLSVRSIIANLSIVIPSGATLASESGVADCLYVWAIDNAGTVELAVSGSNFDITTRIASSTTISAAATSSSTLYSTTGRSNVPIRLIGRLFYTQATAGTWASAGTTLELAGSATNMDYETGSFAAVFSSGAGAGGSSTSKTINFIRQGKRVTLLFPACNDMTAGATASAFSTASATIPKRLRPNVQDLNFPRFGSANGTNLDTPSALDINANGSISMRRTFSGGTNYTSGQTSNGISATSVSYSVQ